MFWLFKRKKVADNRVITPRVCDHGSQVNDAYTLQDFGGTSELIPKTQPHPMAPRRDYQRLESKNPVDSMEDIGSSTESSDGFERDFFGGFTDDEDEELTCNVCERTFCTVRRLEQHQQRLRHYGCSICDSLFPTLMALELHKETLDHWSDYELKVRELQEDQDDDVDSEDEPEEHKVYSLSRKKDELKRLLL